MKILIVVDLQKEFILEPYYSEAIKYIRENRNLYDRVIATRFINTPNSPFVQKLGLLDSMERTSLEFPYTELISKHSYDCGEGFYKHIKDADIDIIGRDTDGSILAMCFEMFRFNMNFHLLADYCYSYDGDEDHIRALEIINKIFGDCIIEGNLYTQGDDTNEGS